MAVSCLVSHNYFTLVNLMVSCNGENKTEQSVYVIALVHSIIILALFPTFEEPAVSESQQGRGQRTDKGS